MNEKISNANDVKDKLKQEILHLVRRYYEASHAVDSAVPFKPGESRVMYAGRVFDEKEMVNLVDASLDYWLTAGPYSDKFEHSMRDYFGARNFLLVNSGSSANLLLISTLCSPELDDLLKNDQSSLSPLRSGDEVITPAVTFPTTLSPILQNNLVPVFVDCRLGTYNIDASLIEAAIGPRTRAIFVPHTLGNPCDMTTLVKVAQEHNLWLLEDCCDALGATYEDKLVGTFGALASLSFYPAHHISMGEGGGVIVNHPRLIKTSLSMRDWGRDCWCPTGVSNTCGKRFGWEVGGLPFGYDHKYIYSNIGYNLKVTDMQAAIGVAQIDKIPSIVAKRRRNFGLLMEGLKALEEHLVLPESEPLAAPSPFGFPLTVRGSVSRRDLVQYLEESKIETRQLFGGNILRQPGFNNIRHRVHGELTNSDRVMTDTFFVGVYPRLNDDMIAYMIETFHKFFAR